MVLDQSDDPAATIERTASVVMDFFMGFSGLRMSAGLFVSRSASERSCPPPRNPYASLLRSRAQAPVQRIYCHRFVTIIQKDLSSITRTVPRCHSLSASVGVLGFPTPSPGSAPSDWIPTRSFPIRKIPTKKCRFSLHDRRPPTADRSGISRHQSGAGARCPPSGVFHFGEPDLMRFGD